MSNKDITVMRYYLIMIVMCIRLWGLLGIGLISLCFVGLLAMGRSHSYYCCCSLLCLVIIGIVIMSEFSRWIIMSFHLSGGTDGFMIIVHQIKTRHSLIGLVIDPLLSTILLVVRSCKIVTMHWTASSYLIASFHSIHFQNSWIDYNYFFLPIR